MICSVLAGVTIFLVAATTFASVTTFNPIQQTLGISRRVAIVITFFVLMSVLACGAAILRLCLVTYREGIGLLLSFWGALAVAAMGATVSRVPLDELLLLVVARYAWWVALVLAAGTLPLVLRAVRGQVSTSWRRWALVGSVAFSAGVALYYFGPRTNEHAELFAKTVLILIVPIVCLLGVAIQAPSVVRIIAVLAALAGVAEAAIH
jgi:hypothetical protein